MHKVFVYGSLKRICSNNFIIEDQQYLGEAKTAEANWQMYSLGAFPGVVAGNNVIPGELYSVDSECLKHLDHFEGHPNFYKRTMIDIIRNNKIEKAWMYVYQGSVSDLQKVEFW